VRDEKVAADSTMRLPLPSMKYHRELRTRDGCRMLSRHVIARHPYQTRVAGNVFDEDARLLHVDRPFVASSRNELEQLKRWPAGDYDHSRETHSATSYITALVSFFFVPSAMLQL